MGVMDYERNRQRQQNIEVKALIALMRYGRTHSRKVYAEKKLCEIAFPEDHIKQAEKIRVEGVCCVVDCLNTHRQTEMVESGTGQTIICVECLEGD